MAHEEVQSSNEVPPRQETQTTLNETNVESQEPEVAAEPSVSPNKRGLKSKYWDHYKRQRIEDLWKAICKYCNKKLGGDTVNGTSHLRDHLNICPVRNKRTPGQTLLKVAEVPGKSRESFVVGNYTFNQDFSRTELAKMIILHEYPIMMVDHAGFRSFIHSLQPLFKTPSRNTTKNDIMKLYETETTKQKNTLAKNKSRIAITTDMWTSSNQNKGYMAVTAHYIDENWILQNRIIRFIYVPAPHTAEVIGEYLSNCLIDWNIDRKLSTLTVDNCSTNDALIDYMINKIAPASFVLNGELM